MWNSSAYSLLFCTVFSGESGQNQDISFKEKTKLKISASIVEFFSLFAFVLQSSRVNQDLTGWKTWAVSHKKVILLWKAKHMG